MKQSLVITREKIRLLFIPDKMKSELLALTYELETAHKRTFKLKQLIAKLLTKVRPIADRFRIRGKVSLKELDELSTRQIDIEDALSDGEI